MTEQEVHTERAEDVPVSMQHSSVETAAEGRSSEPQPRVIGPDSPGPQPQARPRSLLRRVEQQAPDRPRIRSQPLSVQPVPIEDLIAPEPAADKEQWRWTPAAAGLAVLAWIGAVAVMVTAVRAGGAAGASLRLPLTLTWAGAAIMTFAPLQYRLGLPGLTWLGTLGWTMLAYLLAYVPPPTGWLLDLPDLPVYLLFFLAIFYAVTASAFPVTYLVGRRAYTRRLHRLDVRRARRQAYEAGLLVVALLGLASLRVLSALTGLLLVSVFVLVEALLLSQVAPDA